MMHMMHCFDRNPMTPSPVFTKLDTNTGISCHEESCLNLKFCINGHFPPYRLR